MALFDDIDISAGGTDFTLNGRYIISLPVISGATVLQIVSIAVIDSTHLRITFSATAKNNSALITTGNYIISPTLAVHSVVPDSSFTFVTLTVDEMLQSRNYSLEIQNVEAAT